MNFSYIQSLCITINKLHGDSVNLDAAVGQFTPAFTPVVQFRSMEGGL